MNEAQNYKQKILARLKDTPFKFLTPRELRLTPRGFFRLSINNKSISDLTPLQNIPFDELYLDNNPITSFEPL